MKWVAFLVVLGFGVLFLAITLLCWRKGVTGARQLVFYRTRQPRRFWCLLLVYALLSVWMLVLGIRMGMHLLALS
ncbi:hypothetical protein [Xanthomonas tesorieronis]|uniref:hypothetical protein n=1 Tax=Xanthomonas tesorieronis TaxID=3160839 RepID=UPI00351842BD